MFPNKDALNEYVTYFSSTFKRKISETTWSSVNMSFTVISCLTSSVTGTMTFQENTLISSRALSTPPSLTSSLINGCVYACHLLTTHCCLTVSVKIADRGVVEDQREPTWCLYWAGNLRYAHCSCTFLSCYYSSVWTKFLLFIPKFEWDHFNYFHCGIELMVHEQRIVLSLQQTRDKIFRPRSIAECRLKPRLIHQEISCGGVRGF